MLLCQGHLCLCISLSPAVCSTELLCAAGAEGVQPVDASQVTDEVWSHIFLDGPRPASCSIPEPLLQRCRREFDFWYRGGFDLRVRPPESPHAPPSMSGMVSAMHSLPCWNSTGCWTAVCGQHKRWLSGDKMQRY